MAAVTVLLMRRGDKIAAMATPATPPGVVALAGSWASIMPDTSDAEWCCVHADSVHRAKWPDPEPWKETDDG